MVRFLYGGLLATLLTLSACSLGAPERQMNDAAQPPEHIGFAALDTARSYGGMLPVLVTPDLAPFPIVRAYAFVDGQSIAVCEGASCTLGINTDWLDDGPHTLVLALMRTSTADPDLGLLNLVQAGAVLAQTTLTTDQRPPTAVVIDSVRATAEGVAVYWTSPAGTNRNARQFYIERLDGDTPGTPPVVVGRVDAGGPHVFIDQTVPDVDGLALTYRVGTWNGRGTRPGDLLDGSVMGPPVVGYSSPRYDGGPCTSMARPIAAETFLCLQGDRIRRGVIAEGRFVASGAAPRLLTGATARQLIAQPDGSAYYLVESAEPNRVAYATVDPQTLALGPVRTTLIMSENVGQWTAAGGRLMTIGLNGGTATVIDGTLGAVTATIGFLGGGTGIYYGSNLVATPDGRYLVNVSLGGIQRYDFTTETMLNQNWDGGDRTAVDADGRLYVGSSTYNSGNVRVYDAATLALRGTLPGTEGVGAIWVTPDHVFVGLPIGSIGSVYRGHVFRYLRQNGARAGDRRLYRLPTAFAPSADGRTAAATGDVTFITRFN